MYFFFLDIDLGFLADIGNSKSPAAFIVFSLIGLYTSVASVWPMEKRMPNKLDFIKFTAYGPFVVGYALLIGTSPYHSFLIGVIPGPLIQFVIKVAKKVLTENEMGNGNERQQQHKQDESESTKKP